MSFAVDIAAFPNSASVAQSNLRRELAGWAWLAVGSLAVAGLFAILLFLSRLPGIERIGWQWPFDFFGKGLVIHVVFSLVVWLLAMFAMLVASATERFAGADVRLAPLGRAGQAMVAVAFPCLFAPAFLDATTPELTNYIPLIRHPAYDLGLVLLALGVLAPILRLVVNLPGRMKDLPPLTLAMTSGSFVFAIALVCFAVAGFILVGAGKLQTHREYLFWGGGHVLQFLYVIVLLTIWSMLARTTLGEKAIDPDIFKLCVILIAVFTIPAPIFYRAFQAFSVKQQDAYRILQFVLAMPPLLFSVSMLSGALSIAKPANWPWRNPAFVTLIVSLACYAVGGFMGLLISGSDTRTPAHYHAMVTAVSVACMGLLLTWGLEQLDRKPVSERATRLLVAFYGCGQIFASVGLFMAGGYGAQRKTSAVAGKLVDGAVVGMYLHGVGALFAVIGGAAFVIVAIRALGRAGGASPDALARS